MRKKRKAAPPPEEAELLAQAELAFKRDSLRRWFTSPFGQCHRNLQRFLREAPAGSLSVAVAPRGHGKTSLAVVGELLMRALAGQLRFALLGCSSLKRSQDLLRLVREELEGNPAFGRFGVAPRRGAWNARELRFTVKSPGIPGVLPPRPADSPARRTPLSRAAARRLRRRTPCLPATEVRILALGPGQNWRGVIAAGGERPGLVLLDDLENRRNVRNRAVVDERLEMLISDVFPAMSAGGGRMFVIGNLFSRRSALAGLYEDAEKHPHVRRFRFDAEDESGELAWPEHFTEEGLAALRRVMGEGRYAAEFLNRPGDEGVFVKRDEIQGYAPSEIQNRELEVTGFLDPSATHGEESDYQAFVTMGTLRQEGAPPLHYVLDAFLRRCPFSEAVRAVYERAETFHYACVGVESNLFRDWVKEAFMREAGKRQKNIPWLPVLHGRDKRSRLEPLAPLIQRGELRFRPEQPGQDLLVKQLIYFGDPGEHDDGPDALAGCMEMHRLLEARRRRRRPDVLVDDG